MIVECPSHDKKGNVQSSTVWCNQIGTVFLGDVAFESFNMAYRDESSIYDQKYEKQLITSGFSATVELVCIFF